MLLTKIVIPSVDSTNKVAFQMLKGGASPPFILLAWEQKAGKGRYGHHWYSPPGGVWLSLATRGNLSEWTFFSTLAVINATNYLTQNYLAPFLEIKLPNDIMIKGKKVSGILGEEREANTVIGIGWNVNIEVFPGELKERATSLRIETGKEYPLEAAADILVLELEKLGRGIEETPQEVFETWKRSVGDIGKRVRFRIKGHTKEGLLLDITPAFFLLLEDEVEPLCLLHIQDFERIQ